MFLIFLFKVMTQQIKRPIQQTARLLFPPRPESFIVAGLHNDLTVNDLVVVQDMLQQSKVHISKRLIHSALDSIVL